MICGVHLARAVYDTRAWVCAAKATQGQSRASTVCSACAGLALHAGSRAGLDQGHRLAPHVRCSMQDLPVVGTPHGCTLHVPWCTAEHSAWGWDQCMLHVTCRAGSELDPQTGSICHIQHVGPVWHEGPVQLVSWFRSCCIQCMGLEPVHMLHKMHEAAPGCGPHGACIKLPLHVVGWSVGQIQLTDQLLTLHLAHEVERVLDPCYRL